MNLHDNSGVFEDAIRAASDHLDMRTIFVEKDYWVTSFQIIKVCTFRRNCF